MSLTATCATIAAMLASAQGGEVISLKGNCGTITVARQYAREVTINAAGSSVAGLVITGSNVRWRGGTIMAKAGVYGAGPDSYAVRVYKGASHIHFESVTVTGARKGMVIDLASNITVADSRFWRIGDDGIVAHRVTGLTLARIRVQETIGKPSECAVNGVVTLNLSARHCAGQWTDGWHNDAVQLRNATTRVRIYDSLVEGNTQGFAQMDARTDAPLKDVWIYRNIVRTDNFHHITLTNCVGCRITGNRVERQSGSRRKAIIRPGLATRCGNYAQDERVQDARC